MTSVNLDDYVGSPERLLSASLKLIEENSQDEFDRFHLAAFNRRLTAIGPAIAPISAIMNNRAGQEIAEHSDIAAFLLEHEVYKSYPLSFIEKGQYDRLTTWLSRLTTHDLSSVDAKSCTSIDEWIDEVDAKTPIRLMHSSGTTGKLSFIPRSTLEQDTWLKAIFGYFNNFGYEENVTIGEFQQAPFIYMGYRHGATAHNRLIESAELQLYGNPSMIYTLYPGRMSAEVLALGGRLQAADASGARGEIQLTPSLRRLRDAYLEEKDQTSLRTETFFDRIATELRGKPITMVATPGQIYDFAQAGLSKGMGRLFSPKSNILVGGGLKGRDLPDDWDQIVEDFFGMKKLRQSYGMTETIAPVPECEAGNFHLHPIYIPFVIDNETGGALPRRGVQTGRFGLIDLSAQTHWGGFLTGDYVSMAHGDVTCDCGRNGPYLFPEIQRHTAKEGGDDKITCSATPQVHSDALTYLAKMEG